MGEEGGEATEDGAARSGGPPASDLPALAVAAPADAEARCHRLLAGRPDDVTASFARQALGIVLRERGDLAAAVAQLRRAVGHATRTGDGQRVADVRATYGGTLVVAGRSRQGLRELAAAVDAARGPLRATVVIRRAYCLALLGDTDAALADLTAALSAVRRSGDTVWEARIRHNRCFVLLSMGLVERAETDAVAAEKMYEQLGNPVNAVDMVLNRAVIAARRGDIPRALQMFDAAEARYAVLGEFVPPLVVDRGLALLAAGLAPEALETATTALGRDRLSTVLRADLTAFAARAAAAAGRRGPAREHASRAATMFRRQQRPGAAAAADLLAVSARFDDGARSPALRRRAHALATSPVLPAGDAVAAELLVGRFALAARDDAAARAALANAARRRPAMPALDRAAAALAAALLATLDGDDRMLLAACRRGLDALDEHRVIFGAAEIRATATSHTRELSVLAIDAVAGRGTPRALLQWTERSRATSLAEPSVRPTDDAALARDLAVVREAVRQQAEAGADGASSAVATTVREQAETAIRRRRRHLAAAGGATPVLDVGALLGALGGTTLLVLVESRGDLLAVVARDGRVRRHRIGPAADVTKEAEFARFALRRAAHARTPRLASTAARLQQATLGALARPLGDGPLVVVPPSRLHTLPWALLPALADVPFAVAPSARMWQRATATTTRATSVLLATGPDLGTGGAEVEAIAAVHRGATVLDRADVGAVLAGLEGARVAHLAAHGTFRSDSPLFSSLRFHDGELFVHDLDVLRRAPRTVVLSACDSGVGEPVGADELLGLVSGLLRIGTTGVLASVVPVNDVAAVPYMTAVHRSLAAGGSLPEAALAGRRTVADDPLTAATAAGFTAWGA